MFAVQGYNSYPGSGWHRFGRLVVNFHNDRVIGVWFAGVQILSGPGADYWHPTCAQALRRSGERPIHASLWHAV